MAARLGVDIGGTFTDLVAVDETTGAVHVGKVLTTPKDPAHGVEGGIQGLLGEAGVAAAAVRAVVHGTTLATNALIERKGARTALLTTSGFRDTLEIRSEGRYDMYDLFIDPPPPLVPRHLRHEVTGHERQVRREVGDQGVDVEDRVLRVPVLEPGPVHPRRELAETPDPVADEAAEPGADAWTE